MATNCSRLIDVDRLTFADNVRTPECMQIPKIVESFKRHRFKTNHPLVVVEKPGEDGPVYLVLIGNRRGIGLQWLRDNEADEYRRVLPGSKVPAVVHKGLTAEEEVDLRIDHSPDEDRVPLDEWSTFLAIQQLVRVGIDTQERIASKLGLFKVRGKEKGQPNRQFVQTRANLARLPQFVKDEFEKLCRDGKDSTAVRWAHVPKLYKAHLAEYVQHPESDGPEFQAAWTKAITPPEVTDGTPIDEGADPKELSPAEAIKRSQSASSEGLKYALLVVTRQSDRNLAEIDGLILEGESAICTLTQIRDYMGEKDFAELRDISAKHAEEKAAIVESTDETTEEEVHEHPAETVA